MCVGRQQQQRRVCLCVYENKSLSLRWEIQRTCDVKQNKDGNLKKIHNKIQRVKHTVGLKRVFSRLVIELRSHHTRILLPRREKSLRVLVQTEDEIERSVRRREEGCKGQDDEGLFGFARFSSVEQPSVRKSLLKP